MNIKNYLLTFVILCFGLPSLSLSSDSKFTTHPEVSSESIIKSLTDLPAGDELYNLLRSLFQNPEKYISNEVALILGSDKIFNKFEKTLVLQKTRLLITKPGIALNSDQSTALLISYYIVDLVTFWRAVRAAARIISLPTSPDSMLSASFSSYYDFEKSASEEGFKATKKACNLISLKKAIKMSRSVIATDDYNDSFDTINLLTMKIMKKLDKDISQTTKIKLSRRLATLSGLHLSLDDKTKAMRDKVYKVALKNLSIDTDFLKEIVPENKSDKKVVALNPYISLLNNFLRR